MTQEQLKSFLKKVKNDHSLQEMLYAAKDSDAVVAIANTAGVMVSADEFNSKTQPEVLDRELEYISGGGILSLNVPCSNEV